MQASTLELRVLLLGFGASYWCVVGSQYRCYLESPL